MTAPAPPRPEFAVLDRRITQALAVLRSARAACSGGRDAGSHDAGNHEAQQRAEEHLNALLDYRYATQHRERAGP
jgi:hypothetical protein